MHSNGRVLITAENLGFKGNRGPFIINIYMLPLCGEKYLTQNIQNKKEGVEMVKAQRAGIL